MTADKNFILTDKQGCHTRYGYRNGLCVGHMHTGELEGADVSMGHGEGTAC